MARNENEKKNEKKIILRFNEGTSRGFDQYVTSYVVL